MTAGEVGELLRLSTSGGLEPKVINVTVAGDIEEAAAVRGQPRTVSADVRRKIESVNRFAAFGLQDEILMLSILLRTMPEVCAFCAKMTPLPREVLLCPFTEVSNSR